MSRPRDVLPPDRLADAAEAALQAAVEFADHNNGAWVYPAALMGTPDQPDCLTPYTKWEIEQASEFLVRLGYIEKRAA